MVNQALPSCKPEGEPQVVKCCRNREAMRFDCVNYQKVLLGLKGAALTIVWSFASCRGEDAKHEHPDYAEGGGGRQGHHAQGG
jgi:hypothetical protein